VSQDNPPLSIRCVEDLLIRATLPALLLHVNDIEPPGSKVGRDFWMDILIREPP